MIKHALESIKLEHKIIERQSINAMNEVEKTKSDIVVIKQKKEDIALQMVDLEQSNSFTINFVNCKVYMIVNF